MKLSKPLPGATIWICAPTRHEGFFPCETRRVDKATVIPGAPRGKFHAETDEDIHTLCTHNWGGAFNPNIRAFPTEPAAREHAESTELWFKLHNRFMHRGDMLPLPTLRAIHKLITEATK